MVKIKVGDWVRIKRGSYDPIVRVVKINRKTIDVEHSLGLKKGLKAPVSRIKPNKIRLLKAHEKKKIKKQL